MIPNKIRRTINVDGIKYEYCVRGKQKHSKDVYIKNLTTNKQISWYVDDHFENVAITAKDIRNLILNDQLFGVTVK